jgi:hypothetical protein
MAKAIDTISITDNLRQRVPGIEVPFEGDGLQVILDSQEQSDVATTAGKRASILRPDGSTVTWTIAGSVVNSQGVTAIFFGGMQAREVPRLSEITW